MLKRHRSTTLFQRILIPLVIVIVLQALLLCFSLFLGEPMRMLDRNMFQVFNTTTSNRASNLESDMTQYWSVLDECQKQLLFRGQILLQEKAGTIDNLGVDPDLTDAFLSKVSTSLIYTLRKNRVTGIFIILNGNDSLTPSGDSQKSGLYFRDYNPDSKSSDNSDLFIEKGPTKVCESLGIPLDVDWTPKFSISPQDDFFYKPLIAYRGNPELGAVNSAYWDGPIQVEENDKHLLTYTQPLLDSSGQAYGVLGVSITTEYFYQLLPHEELAAEGNASYILAKKIPSPDGSTVEYKPIVAAGPAYKRLLHKDTALSFEKKEFYKNFHYLSDKHSRDKFCGSIIDLPLYNTNTPFTEESLVLIGLSKESDILNFSYWLRKSCIIILVASLGCGVLAALLIGYLTASPITRLSNKVKTSNPSKPIYLDRIHISEIDQLSSSIEELSASVAEHASKLSNILDMASVPVAAFEYRTGEPTAFCSKNFYKMMGLGSAKTEDFMIPVSEFNTYLKQLQTYISASSSDEDTGIYKLKDEQGISCWYRLTIHRSEEIITGVITDVTLEIAEKHRLEYERDYDILTNLLNRRAFLTAVNRLFSSPALLKKAALVTIDLDNLKYMNDTYGHDWGDEYLKSTSEVLRGLSNEHTVTARMSGDEFNLFFYGYDRREELEMSVNSLRSALRNTFLHLPDGSKMRLRASAGIAWYPDDSTVLDNLIKYADFAMYEVKHSNKGQLKEFDLVSYEKDSYLLKGREDLNRLIEEKLIDYAFQPIISVADGSVMGYEALMRPQLESLNSPAAVLNLAKEQSKLQQIEVLTFMTATEVYFHKHMCRCSKYPLLFINSIPGQMLTEEEMRVYVTQFEPYLHNIVIEFTEMTQIDQAFMEMKKQLCTQYHMHVALDDYGTGHNSEEVLLMLMPDYVKLDFHLIHHIDQDKNRLDFLENMITYFKTKNIKIIAEGIETKAEMEILVQCGVEYLQGYYFGHPTLIPQPPYEEAICALADARSANTRPV